MNFKKSLLPMLAACLFAAPVIGDDFDGSRQLICATVEARDCILGEACFGGSSYEVGAPAFLQIDFEQKSIAGPKQTTPILLMEKSDGQLLLQGTELGYGWSFALDQASGRFSASLANIEGVFVLFGSCKAL